MSSYWNSKNVAVLDIARQAMSSTNLQYLLRSSNTWNITTQLSNSCENPNDWRSSQKSTEGANIIADWTTNCLKQSWSARLLAMMILQLSNSNTRHSSASSCTEWAENAPYFCWSLNKTHVTLLCNLMSDQLCTLHIINSPLPFQTSCLIYIISIKHQCKRPQISKKE